MVGGNAVGIFIHSVEYDSAACQVGLRCADQILEYNGVDLREATAEQAAYELAKPAADNVSILVQYNPDRYNVIKDQPGDSYYVRSMFARFHSEYSDPPQLAFNKDDILYVDNTMYNGVPGHWSAWLVDQDGKRTQWGIVPSKYKVEEELMLKKSSGELDQREGGSALALKANENARSKMRRSFLIRKKNKSTRSSSRDSKELASYSDVSSLSYADSMGAIHPDSSGGDITSYVRVERMDYLVTRPVLIIGPLADAVVDKLASDYPHKFARCEQKFVSWNHEDLEREMLAGNSVVDYRKRGAHYECTTVEAIREICDRNQHCILNIHIEAVERLHLNQIYPIVLLVKFKSVKQIKEVKVPPMPLASSSSSMVPPSSGSMMSSSSGSVERISQKDAKTIFEHTQKLEETHRHLVSDTIHAGANLMLMCSQIVNKVDQEQNKTLWVPSGTIW